eukprot:1209201-Rhodomonas_salina.1
MEDGVRIEEHGVRGPRVRMPAASTRTESVNARGCIVSEDRVRIENDGGYESRKGRDGRRIAHDPVGFWSLVLGLGDTMVLYASAERTSLRGKGLCPTASSADQGQQPPKSRSAAPEIKVSSPRNQIQETAFSVQSVPVMRFVVFDFGVYDLTLSPPSWFTGTGILKADCCV